MENRTTGNGRVTDAYLERNGRKKNDDLLLFLLKNKIRELSRFSILLDLTAMSRNCHTPYNYFGNFA